MSGPYKADEVAAMVGATEWFIRHLADEKRIPCYRVGRNSPRFTDEHVAAVIEHLTQPVEDDTAGPIATSRRRRAS